MKPLDNYLPSLGKLPPNWKVIQLKKILNESTRNGIYKKKEYHGKGIRIVNMGELFAYDKINDQEMKLIDLNDDELHRFKLIQGDLLFARRSLVASGAGKCSIVEKHNTPMTFESSIIRARPDANKAEPLFLFYLFNSDFGGNLMNSIVRQVAVAGITGGDLMKVKIPFPPLPEQRAIADILSSLDDNIELNNQMNKTLQQIAQAIFKRWFVEFEFPITDPLPLREGGPISLGEGTTYKSSSGKMVESELGMIPYGWKTGQLSEILTIDKTSINPSEYADEYFYHYSIPSYDEKKFPGIEDGQSIKSNKFIISDNVVLISKLNPRIPRVWLPFSDGKYKSICSTEFIVTKPINNFSVEYIYNLFQAQDFQSSFKSLVTGTSSSHQRVKPEYLLSMDIIIPKLEIIKMFTNMSRELLTLINHNIKQINTLSQLRDTLLPKLMSGELRVPPEKVKEYDHA